ncbi:MAG: hypothetical protein JWO06_3563 [Bacteroidota bacterium]|nr:hypothetical protein [Bacteroidota bacterium]
MKKYIFLLPVLLFAVNTLSAQDDELPPPSSKPKTDAPASAPNGDSKDFQGFQKKKKIDLSKFIIEPNFNFNISQDRIDAGVSPYVGYNVWKGLYAGGGVTYFYTGFKNIAFTDYAGRTFYANANYHTYGGGVFLQYNVWKSFFVRSRFEVLHRHMDDLLSGNVSVQVNPQTNSYQVVIPKVDKTIPALLLGVGYNLLASKNFFFPIMISYNVLYGVTDKVYTIYPNHGWVLQLGFVNVF